MKRFAAMLMLAASACSMEPALRPTPLPVPPSWPVGDAYLRQSEAPLPAVTYRDVFRDARLQTLMIEALANNRDLRIAAANIAAARAQVRVTRSGQFPEVDASGRATVNRADGDTRVSYAADLSVPSFEIDLFGRLASLTRADQQRLLATEAGARATRIALVGDIADAWLAYAADSSLLQIAQATATSASKSVELTRARLEGGIAPRTDLAQATQVLETARQDLAEQKAATAKDVNLLQLLVGAPIDPALLPQAIESAAPTIAALPAGLDSTVLLRRPDVVQAEFQLRAANAEIGAARAALFPRISLTGLLGLASSALTSLIGGGALAASAGGAVDFPIFDAGGRRARVALTQADKDAALASYERAIQTAFREVADALADRGTIAERLRAARANAAAAADTQRLVDARYRGGIDPFLTSLDAQRSYYAAARSEVAVQLAEGQNAVALYRALGADNQLAR